MRGGFEESLKRGRGKSVREEKDRKDKKECSLTGQSQKELSSANSSVKSTRSINIFWGLGWGGGGVVFGVVFVGGGVFLGGFF